MKEKVLQLNKIEPETVEIYHDDEGFLGHANEYEFNDLRLRIHRYSKVRAIKQSLTKYYILKDDKKHYIYSNGRLEEWNFFGLISEQLDELTIWDQS